MGLCSAPFDPWIVASTVSPLKTWIERASLRSCIYTNPVSTVHALPEDHWTLNYPHFSPSPIPTSHTQLSPLLTILYPHFSRPTIPTSRPHISQIPTLNYPNFLLLQIPLLTLNYPHFSPSHIPTSHTPLSPLISHILQSSLEAIFLQRTLAWILLKNYPPHRWNRRSAQLCGLGAICEVDHLGHLNE